MKYNCFDDLISLSHLSVVLSKEFAKDSFDLIKKSAKTKNSCITKAQKQFVPPIDREDIVRLALMLHTFNCDVVFLSKYSRLCEHDNLLSLINSGIITANQCIENTLKIDVENVLNRRDDLYLSFLKEKENLTSESTFNTKALIKNNFFDKIDKCFENTVSIVDEIIFIAIKNS